MGSCLPCLQNQQIYEQRCKVKNCPQNHPFHYCRNCNNKDSNHFATSCPSLNKQNKNDAKIIFDKKLTGNMNYYNQQEKNNKAFEQRNKILQHTKRCKVRDCNQNHYQHYCKNCNTQDSDHKSSNCTKRQNIQERKQVITIQQKQIMLQMGLKTGQQLTQDSVY